MSHDSINLLPATRLSSRAQQRRVTMWSAAVGVEVLIALSLCLFAGATWGRQAGAVGRGLDEVDSQIKSNEAKVTELRATLSKLDAANRSSAMLSDRPDWSILLAILSRSLGDDAVLSAVSIQPRMAAPVPAVAGKPPVPVNPIARDFVVNLKGSARSSDAVSRFVLQLQRIELFDDVSLLRSRRDVVRAGLPTTFEIESTLVEMPLAAPPTVAGVTP